MQDYVQILNAKKIKIIGDSYDLKNDLKNYLEIVDNNMAPECLIITDENHSFEVEEYIKRAKKNKRSETAALTRLRKIKKTKI